VFAENEVLIHSLDRKTLALLLAVSSKSKGVHDRATFSRIPRGASELTAIQKSRFTPREPVATSSNPAIPD
jgi:hypothetical protein